MLGSRRSPYLRWSAGATLLALLLSGAWLVSRDATAPGGALTARVPDSQFGGAVSAVALTGTLAWLGTGNRLQAVDLADPAAPRALGQSSALREAIRSIAVEGDTVYAAAGSAGLAIFDGSNPQEPLLSSRLETRWASNDVAILGTICYLADGNRGLRIVDVSDPAAPRDLGRLDTPGDALGVVVARQAWHHALSKGGRGGSDTGETSIRDGLLAYVADWGTGVRVIDVTNPQAPRELAWIDTPGVAADVALSSDLLLVADRTEGLRIVDVSDPTRPHERSSLALPGIPERLATSGNHVFVAAQNGGAWVVDVSAPDDPKLGEALDGTVVVVDVATVGQTDAQGGAAEARLGRAPAPARVVFADVGSRVAPAIDSRADLWARMHIWGVEGAPKIATGLSGLHVATLVEGELDVVGNYVSPGLIEGGDLFDDEALLYLADGLAGVLVLDVANPAAPELVGSLDLPGAAHDVLIEGHYALVAAGEAGLILLDASDPRRPRTIATHDTPGEAFGLAVHDGLVYVADGPGGLRVIDARSALFSTAVTPQFHEVGAVHTTDRSWDVAISDDYAYVSDRVGGLRILDLSEAARPREVAARFANEADVLDVVLVGDRAWVAGGLSGVRLLDVTDPTTPVELAIVSVPDRALGLLQHGSRLFVAAGTAGLLEVHTDSDAPVVRNRWTMAGTAERLVGRGDWLYVAAEMGGLQIISLDP